MGLLGFWCFWQSARSASLFAEIQPRLGGLTHFDFLHLLKAPSDVHEYEDSALLCAAVHNNTVIIVHLLTAGSDRSVLVLSGENADSALR